MERICVVPLHIILLIFFYFLNWPDHLTSVDSHSTFKSVCTWVRINMHNPDFQAFFFFCVVTVVGKLGRVHFVSVNKITGIFCLCGDSSDSVCLDESQLLTARMTKVSL